jgi:serine/threonine protein kinase
MIPERWQRIKSLLESALEREPHARAVFLKEACSDDPALQSEVESLIASHEQAGGFIESPAFELMAESLDQSHSIVGSELGPYRVTGRLGSGGMGEVYLAQDMRLGRKVALKVLLAHFTRDEERVRRFQQEARAASALNHPNIVTIHEIGEVTSRHFIVTEVIEGETLRRHLANGEIEFSEALDIAIQIASALSAAHAAGIVHRDIKPDNVMIRADGIVKVLDFGLAKLTEPKSGEFQAATLINTQEGLVMGTAHYMSPEQARGFLMDARTDIWSLGVVLYEMIASRVPFDGETGSDVMAAILGREPMTLARHKPEVPTELEWIVKKALRKDREERYQTARELLTDLKNLKHRLEFEAEVARSESGEAVAVATAGSQEAKSTNEQSSKPATFVTSSHPVRRKRGKTLGVAIAIIVGILAMSYLLLNAGRKRKDAASSQNNAGFTQLTDQAGAEFFPSLSPDGQSVVYASRATRNWDIYLQQVGSRNSINLTKDSPADDTQPAFSPDGRLVAFRSERDGGGIYVMGATGESVTRLSSFGYSPAWSPDGEQILFGTEKIPQPSTRPSKSQLWAINTSTNERRLISEGDALQPNCSPHGNRIAFWSRPSKAGQRESISTIPAAGGDAVAVTDGATTDLNPVWSPDGKFLYFSSNRGGSINIWRVAIDEKSGAVSGQPEAITTIGAATSALQLSFARDGRQLAYIAQEEIRNLRKISFDPSSGKATGEPISITTGSMQLWFPDASPDGEWLTCYSMGNQRHIFIMRTDGSELRDLTDDSYRHFWPRWSPDGKRIAFSSRRSGNYELWAINRDGGGLQQLTSGHPSPGAHYNPWSPDGKHIAYSIHAPKNDCIMFEPDKAWSEQKLEYLPPLSDSSLSFEAWSWSPDGKKLAGVRHLPSGVHSGIGVYDLESKNYTWFTDFGDWPLWFKDNRHLLFVSQGQILLFDTRSGKYQPVLTVTDQDVDIGSPALSPDNRTIYFTYVAAEADIWLMTLE